MLKNFFSREPVAILEAGRTVVLLAIAFGFSVSSEQLGAIMAVFGAITALVTRGIVSSPAQARELLMTPPPKDPSQ